MSTAAAELTYTVVLRRGARVETTGAGRTARWGRYVGTVLRVRHGRVYVRWDGLGADDEMEPAEVRPESLSRSACPCAQHRHS